MGAALLMGIVPGSVCEGGGGGGEGGTIPGAGPQGGHN